MVLRAILFLLKLLPLQHAVMHSDRAGLAVCCGDHLRQQNSHDGDAGRDEQEAAKQNVIVVSMFHAPTMRHKS